MNSKGKDIIFRKLEDCDRIWIDGFIKEQWGSNYIAVHHDVYYPAQMEGFIAENNGSKAGLITYKIQDQSCEIITLNSTIEHCGVGRNLVNLVVKEAAAKGCKKVWLITTNDNIRAIEFYQKTGFRLVKVCSDAVDDSRKLKPEIPLIADNGIPIRDELVFVLSPLQDLNS